MKRLLPILLILLAGGICPGQKKGDQPELSARQVREKAATLHRQMYKAFQRKDYAQASEKCVDAANLPLPDSVRRHFLYNHACALARLGRKKQALEKLTAAVDAGWHNVSHMQKDPDLDSLRKTRTYKKLVEKLNRGVGPDIQKVGGKTVITGRPAGGLSYRVLLGAVGQKEPARRLVVWLHPSGSLANHAAESLAQTFWKHNLGVMVFENKSPAGWSQQDIANIAPAVAAAGKSGAVNPDRPLLLGYSAGGQVALDLWRKNPGAYGGLILDAAYPLEMEAYRRGKVKLTGLKSDAQYKDTPLFVLVGQQDGGSKIWKQAQKDWAHAHVPLTVHYVPDGKHEWLFKRPQIQQLDTWLQTLDKTQQQEVKED